MLAVEKKSRYADAAAVHEAMRWVAEVPSKKQCRDLLEQRVAPLLRALFLRNWEEKEGEPWQDNAEYGKRYFERVAKNKKSRHLAGKEQVKTKLEAGDSRMWDISLLCTILLWYNVHPLKQEEHPQDHADISDIQELRNDLSHQPNSDIPWDLDNDRLKSRIANLWRFIERHESSQTTYGQQALNFLAKYSEERMDGDSAAADGRGGRG